MSAPASATARHPAAGGVGSSPSIPPTQQRVTRDDILRAGRSAVSGPPAGAWDFAPLALAALKVLPGDSEIRFLLAAAYAKLGLKTAALEQLDRLPEPNRAASGPVTLRAQCARLPDDRVGLDELRRTLDTNLAALAARAIITPDLRVAADSWPSRAARREHFRASFGDIVWRAPGDVTGGGWERFTNQADQAMTVRLPHDENPMATTYPMWYVVEGADPPALFARVHKSTSNRYDGYAPLVFLLQADAAQFIDGLAQSDISRELADDRVRVFVGADTAPRFESFLRDRAAAGARVTSVTIGLPTTGARLAPSPQELVTRIATGAQSEGALARRRVESIYAGRDRHWWSARFTAARSGTAEPLRVLIATSRFSTFLRHSGADLAEALTAAGCAVRILTEPDAHTLNDLLANWLAIQEHRPDLIILPNYLRATLDGWFPAGLPFVTWVQDAMPQLFEKGAGARVGELDFVVGNIREEMFQKFGYPRQRAMFIPMAASARKFHAGPGAPELVARHQCEIAYVSHHSQTPEALHRRRADEVSGSGPRAVAMLDDLFPCAVQIARSGIADGPLMPRLRAATAEALRRAGLPDDEPGIAALLNGYTAPIADRAMRHQTLEWASAIAARRGWRMNLYGRGWETHPTLAPLAKGELDHADDLSVCYQTAATHLHVSAHTAIHQRVFECALSGGLPICRLQADDLSQLEYLAGAGACRAGAPATIHPARMARHYHYHGYALNSCEQTRRYDAFLRALQLPEPEAAWLNGVHVERLQSSPDEPIDGEGQSLWDLWPDPAAVMFHDQPTLEALLERAVQDPAWRTSQSQALRQRASERVTYDALADAVLAFVGAGLRRENIAPPRWYDSVHTTQPGQQPHRTDR